MADANQAPKDPIGFLDFYLVQKAPFQIPDAGREWIVKFGPWITLVLLIIALPAVLFVFGVGTMLLPFGSVAYVTGFGYASVLVVANSVLMIAALPGLFAQKRSGWNLLFYAELIHIVSSLVAGLVPSGLLSGLIRLYILFQIRTLYRP